jgi:hypothetical protein
MTRFTALRQDVAEAQKRADENWRKHDREEERWHGRSAKAPDTAVVRAHAPAMPAEALRAVSANGGRADEMMAGERRPCTRRPSTFVY